MNHDPPPPAATPCQCPHPGYCTRHNIVKPPSFWKLCRTHIKYFNAWEKGRGPGQRLGADSPPRVPGLDPEIIQQRITICEQCDYYADYRCTLHQLGCRNSFQRMLATPKTACPRKLWPPCDCTE